MITRTHVVLLALLAGLIALDLALAPDRARREDSGVLFPRLDPAAVHRIEVEDAGGALVLERDDTGWRLGEPDGFAAESRAVTEWLGGLSRVLEADRVGRLDTGAEAYGFTAEEGVEVRILGARGERLAAYRQGTRPVSARAGSGRLGVHLSPAGSGDVYRASGVPPVEARAERFWNPRLFEVSADAVRSFELRAGGRAAAFERGSDGGWLVRRDGATREAPGLLVAEMLAAARSLYFATAREEAPGPPHGFDEPAARLVVELEDGARLELLVGGRTPEGARFAVRSDWEGRYVAELPEAAFRETLGDLGPVGRLLAAVEAGE